MNLVGGKAEVVATYRKWHDVPASAMAHDMESTPEVWEAVVEPIVGNLWTYLAGVAVGLGSREELEGRT